jgi:predicted RecA/RadA family phage recombinase
MRNYVQPGKTITLTAPTGGVTAGLGYFIGGVFVIATGTVAATLPFEGMTEGVFDLAKTSAQAWSEGDDVYWDAANSRATTFIVGTRRIGVAVAAAANPSATGRVRLDAVGATQLPTVAAETSITTAGAVTLTAAQLLTRTIVRDPAGADRTDTLPTAALLVAAIPGVRVGDLLEVRYVNGADAAETITIAAGTGGAFLAAQTAASRVIPQNSARTIRIRFTNVTAAAEAYTVSM